MISYQKVVDALVYLEVIDGEQDIEEQMADLASVEITTAGLLVRRITETMVEVGADEDHEEPEPEPEPPKYRAVFAGEQ